MELDDVTHARVASLAERGDSLAAQSRYDEAIVVYEKAWELLPEPKENWEAATWLQAAIGDAWFLKGNYADALRAFTHALLCPAALGNPFLHLRLGQAHFEVGDKSKALDELTRAYMGAGEELFQQQDEKYLRWLREHILPPALN